MKVGSLFDLITAAHGLLDLFSEVETTEQVVSRCERLKRGQYPEALLDSVDELRGAVESMLSDTLDMHPQDDEEDPEDELSGADLNDPELDDLMKTDEPSPPATTEPEAKEPSSPDPSPQG